ncbi:5-formyltetrahydrofolate cyclo-ligase [Rhizobium sp. CC-YZS058]|uniref:5-formyltetrahydrofolate cyclo-ligase n=1 Tax=Rhizobium sp. CC-YZS058 TaxID=3042153 RepID=UPI002B05BA56|nr:5-formyltetrahydrofolate cyclo-ligase [Rhizobium sp. CC-YZS058]MEA3535864.1 5-formyltetrahydrofolate cyclo-ligase [Rhizobium sp. CC-YZS058]
MVQPRVIRQKIWDSLKAVARPDTRFHLSFSEFIPDFIGADVATDRLTRLKAFRDCRLAFVTPDNSMTELRRRLIVEGKGFVMSTYNMQRGFLYMAPGIVPPEAASFAAWLDGMEYFARPVDLADLSEIGRFDLLATGASAVTRDGIRFGKGHTFFDLEWAMFTDIGLVHEQTPVAAIVHDVQVVEEQLNQSETDIQVDYIATPSRLATIERQKRRPRGVRWERLTREEIASLPPLNELARMRGVA